MEKYEKLILTAGPSITGKEISYVNDAVINGWNNVLTTTRRYVPIFR